MTETATAQNPTEATASTEAPVDLLATATEDTGTQQTQSTETQTATTSETPAAETTSSEPVKTTNAPEKYEFTAPEGMQYDSQILEAFSGAAKAADLTQDAAQKLIETMAPALAARHLEQVKALQQQWHDASVADKEFGGEKLKENLAIAKRAYDAYDPIPAGETTTELRALLDQSGLVNHPAILRFFYRAGKAISEDTVVTGSPAVHGTRTLADVLYGAKQ